MTEKDYIIASELTRLRCAVAVLRDVCAENAAGPMRVTKEQAVAEWAHIWDCLDAWVARLERASMPRDRDREPERRDFPIDARKAAER